MNALRSAVRSPRVPAPFFPRRVSCSHPVITSRWSSTTPTTSPRQWSTSLAKIIAQAIQNTGPISIAAYMRQCLTSPAGGYYTSQADGHDQFGQKGDFVTSPEISQIFGELLGIWIVAEWMSQGRKSNGVELVEVGPGRGTLMDDVLRTVRNFSALASSIESVYLIEASPSLREKQKQLLCADAPMDEIDIGFQSISKYGGIPVTWCEDIRFVPNDASKSPFIVAHEFFDALPIYAFQSVASSVNKQPDTIQGLSGPIKFSTGASSQTQKPQWRELVVVHSPPASTIITTLSGGAGKEQTDFQLSLAKASTPSSLVIPETSPRYQALKASPGSVIEVSPESQSYAAEFARRIGGATQSSTSAASPSVTPKAQPSGAALILDYGPADTIPTSTLRGIQGHKLVSPLSNAGLVDISTDVDFTALAEAAINASSGIEVHGPVEQGQWLTAMGIRERASLLEKTAKKEGGDSAEVGEAVKRIKSAVDRLVERGGGGMGRLYKVMAIVPENGGKRKPVGFGGEVDT